MLLAHDGVGEGAAVVLIHGITECRQVWQPLIAPLAERYRVVAVDLRGHGESEAGDAYDPITLAGDVAETLAHLDAQSPLVVGHSLGGVVATAFAAIAHPRAVINVDQPLRLAAFKDGLSQLEPMLRGDAATFQAAMDMVFQPLAGPLPAAEATRVDALRRADRAVVLAIWQTIFDSTPNELDEAVAMLTSAVTVPYLSLHGIDPGPEYSTWLSDHIPTATVEVWPEHGHYPHFVQQERFLSRLTEFDRQSLR
ncbi:MAG: alpha/beta hydrolase [Actinobacteria bacterium]|nr:alpha/beta hydrolase [Actinomycetota bacterium]